MKRKILAVLSCMIAVAFLFGAAPAGPPEEEFLQHSPFRELEAERITRIEIPNWGRGIDQMSTATIVDRDVIGEVVGLLKTIPFWRTDVYDGTEGKDTWKILDFYFEDGSMQTMSFPGYFMDNENMIATDQEIYEDVLWERVPEIAAKSPHVLHVLGELRVDSEQDSLIITKDNSRYKEVTNLFELRGLTQLLRNPGTLYRTTRPEADKLVTVFLMGPDGQVVEDKEAFYDENESEEYRAFRVYYDQGRYCLEVQGEAFTVSSAWGEQVTELYSSLTYPEQEGFYSGWGRQVRTLYT